MKIEIRKIREEDLEAYTYWKLPIHEYHNFNGPYYKRASKEEVESEVNRIAEAFQNNNDDPLPKRRVITNEKGELIGEVSWYWKSEETNWMEIGIAIFDEKNWGKGIGYTALKSWVDILFETKKDIARLGLSTWSGNIGMIKVAEKLGMKKEAEYRNARIVDGKYYDSVSYGVLREEWEIYNHLTC